MKYYPDRRWCPISEEYHFRGPSGTVPQKDFGWQADKPLEMTKTLYAQRPTVEIVLDKEHILLDNLFVVKEFPNDSLDDDSIKGLINTGIVTRDDDEVVIQIMTGDEVRVHKDNLTLTVEGTDEMDYESLPEYPPSDLYNDDEDIIVYWREDGPVAEKRDSKVNISLDVINSYLDSYSGGFPNGVNRISGIPSEDRDMDGKVTGEGGVMSIGGISVYSLGDYVVFKGFEVPQSSGGLVYYFLPELDVEFKWDNGNFPEDSPEPGDWEGEDNFEPTFDLIPEY